MRELAGPAPAPGTAGTGRAAGLPPEVAGRQGTPISAPLWGAGSRHQQLPAADCDAGPVDGFEVIDAFSRRSLGRGRGAERPLQRQAMSARSRRSGLRQQARPEQGERRRLVATEACRRAANGDEFLAMVKDEPVSNFEVIPRERRRGLPPPAARPCSTRSAVTALVFDIGGGSTELSGSVARRDERLGGSPRLLDMTSLAAGRRHPHRFVREALAARVSRSRAPLRRHGRAHAAPILRDVLRRARDRQGRIARGRGPDARRLGHRDDGSAHHLGLKRYDRTMVDGSAHRPRFDRRCHLRPALAMTMTSGWTCLHRQRSRRSGAGRRRHPRGIFVLSRLSASGSPTGACAKPSRPAAEGVPTAPMRQADREADPFCVPWRLIAASTTGRRATVRVKTAQGPHHLLAALAAAPAQRSLCRRAKKRGYRSRAAFKLLQIDDQFRFLRPAPGSSISAPRPAAGPRSPSSG